MRVEKVKGGWRWGKKGKVFRTRREAEAQGRAAYMGGYRGGKKR